MKVCELVSFINENLINGSLKLSQEICICDSWGDTDNVKYIRIEQDKLIFDINDN